jgi:LacI family transcriptional regulator
MAAEFIPEQSKADSVGFVLRTGAKLYSQSPFFGHVQHGLHDYLAEHGVSLVFLGIENNLDVEKLGQLYANRHSFRGVAVLGEVARPFLHALKKLEPRIISVSAQYPGLCHSVVSNEEQAAEQIVQHLVDLGHRRFAWLGGNTGMQRARRRFEAVTSALRLRNLSIEPKFTAQMEGGERIEGRQASEILLKAGSRADVPTAWICYNGTMARGATNYLLQEGIKIPGQISVATFDRTRICEEENPTLTGANTMPELIGRVAGEMLLNSDGEKEGRFSDTILSSELIVRESTGKVSAKKIAA